MCQFKMSPTVPNRILFSRGYPAALSDLKSVANEIEPDLVLELFALLSASGMAIDYCEADVVSGHATQFIYSRDHPECVQLAFVPPVETLFRALHVTWKEVTPSGPDAAFAVLHEWISQGRVCLAKMNEPLLVFGYSGEGIGAAIQVARLNSDLGLLPITMAECESQYWRYPLDEGNLLLSIESAPKQAPDMKELVAAVVRRIAWAWYSHDLAGCAVGETAYEQVASDFRDATVDFAVGQKSAWMGEILRRQWTARISLHRFFERTAPRYGGPERQVAAKAAFCYGQCVDSWRKWSKHLGTLQTSAWRNPEVREKAAVHLDDAREWEGKAVEEVTRLIR